MYILGLNAFHGDSSAALFKDDKLIIAIEEERLRRIKHWAGFPSMAIQACLNEAGISIEQIDHIAVSRDPKANFVNKIIHTAKHPKGLTNIVDRLKNQKNIFSIKEHIAKNFGIDQQNIKAEIHHVEHHLAHMASAFYVSPFDNAAILSIDGLGDFTSTMIGQGTENKIKVLDKVIFPHSIGFFYTAFTQWLGFDKYGDEYKVMGLAPYGEAKYLDKMLDIVILTENGLFKLNQKYFKHQKEGVTMTWENGAPVIAPIYSDYLVDRFGKPRRRGEELTQYHKDIASSVQKMTEITIFHILNKLYEQTNTKNLCIAGGVAQNSVANGKIYLHTNFENIYVPPAATDAGTAVGAALQVIKKLGIEHKNTMLRANWGQKFSDNQIEKALNEKKLRYQKLDDNDIFELVTNTLINGGVVGWYQDRSELGPRALGYRSILADPRRSDAREILNRKIKKREPFRPFAPSILEEHVDDYFEQNHPVPFMEKVFVIKPEKRRVIPAVTHVDGTGRLQTVSHKTNPRYYNLIKRFYDKTGVPLVLNTSFNENEPIVNTPAEAIDTFLRTNMDLLILENYVVEAKDKETE